MAAAAQKQSTVPAKKLNVPSVPSQPSQSPQPSSSRSLLPIFLLIIVLVLSAGGFYVFRSMFKKTAQTVEQKSTQVKTEAPAPEGPLLGMWGKISQIEKADKNEPNLATGAGTKAEGKITIQSDSGKKYEISVNGTTLVNLYRTGTSNKTGEVLPEKTNFEFLNVGDRIYFVAAADLKVKTSLSANEIKFVEVYRKESESK